METANWSSLHVFLSDPAQSLRFLREWLTPQIKKLTSEKTISAWFFIRYWDGGPHLRLRFATRDAVGLTDFQRQLGAAVDAYKAPRPLTREEYYGAHKFDGGAVDVASLAWYGDGAVVPIAYEPETVRYGGARAVHVNERLFRASSDIALRLCAADGRTPQQHLATAMLLMAAGYLAFNRSWSDAANFFSNYAAYWRAYSEAAVAAEAAAGDRADSTLVDRLRQLAAALDNRDSPATLESAWAHQVRAAISDFETIHAAGELLLPTTGNPASAAEFAIAVELMLSSQLHMMNNRLGVLPQQEAYLARTLANAFRELQP